MGKAKVGDGKDIHHRDGNPMILKTETYALCPKAQTDLLREQRQLEKS